MLFILGIHTPAVLVGWKKWCFDGLLQIFVNFTDRYSYTVL